MVRTTPGQKIPLDKLQATLSTLEKLEQKAKDELSLRESIAFLSEKLQSALKKGYSYQDLVEILVQQEIKISAATLKQYLTELEKEKRSRPRGGRSNKSKQTNAVATENLPASSDKVQEDKLMSDAQQPEVEDAVDAAAIPPQVQSTTAKKQTSEKGTKTTKRQTASASQPKDDLTSPPKDNLANEFNQY